MNVRQHASAKQVVNNLLEADDPDNPAAFMQNYVRGRFYVATRAANNKTYFWHRRIPSWIWLTPKPDSDSAKEYVDAIAIARNLRGKSIGFPHNLAGPKAVEMFIVPEEGGNFVKVS